LPVEYIDLVELPIRAGCIGDVVDGTCFALEIYDNSLRRSNPAIHVIHHQHGFAGGFDARQQGIAFCRNSRRVRRGAIIIQILDSDAADRIEVCICGVVVEDPFAEINGPEISITRTIVDITRSRCRGSTT
jgi:hypothetical protein